MFISESCSPKVHAINFRFTRTTDRLQPVNAKRQLSDQPPVLDEVFSLLRVSRHIYISGIPEQLSISVYVHTMADSQARLRPRLLLTFKA